MRYLLTILFLFSLTVYGQTYYVSNAGSNSNDGLTISTPFATIAKATSVATTGSIIKLKRGDSWREMVTIPADSIMVEDYGTGAKPLINCLDTLKTWSLVNPDSLVTELVTNGTFESGISGQTITNGTGSNTALSWNTSTPIVGVGSLNMANTSVGTSNARPIWGIATSSIPSATSIIISFKYRVNSGTAILHGIYTGAVVQVLDQSLTGSGVFVDTITTSATLSSLTVYMDGRNLFNIDIDSLTAHNTYNADPTKIWYANSLNGMVILNTVGFGYNVILEDSLCTQVASINNLTQDYRMYLNRTDAFDTSFQIFIYSAINPNSRFIQASNKNYGIYSNAKGYLTVKNINIIGAGSRGVFLYGNAGNSTIDSVDTRWSRLVGIQLYEGYNHSLVTKCSSYQDGNGIYAASYNTSYGSNYNTFTYNRIYNVIHNTVGVVSDGHGLAVYASNHCVIKYNYTYNCQSGGIAADFGLAGRDTAGSIDVSYNWIEKSQTNSSGIKIGGSNHGTININNNLLVNNAQSGDAQGSGMAITAPLDSCGHVNILYNTISNIDSTSGIPLIINKASYGIDSNITMKGNIFCSIMSGSINNLALITPAIKMVVDSNLWNKQPDTYYWNYNGSSLTSLAAWQSAVNGAANDTISVLTGITAARPILKYNNSNSEVGYIIPGTFIDVRGVNHINYISLAPYESAILWKAITDLPNPPNTPIATKSTYKITQ